jgi:threonine 3-dehydrogenase
VLAFNGRRIFETWYKTRLLLETGVVDLAPLVTHRMPLEAIDEAMTLLARGQAGKVILLPQPA